MCGVDVDTKTTGETFASAGDRTSIVQYVVRHYTDWATRLPDWLLI
jgi:hypothetical protein